MDFLKNIESQLLHVRGWLGPQMATLRLKLENISSRNLEPKRSLKLSRSTVRQKCSRKKYSEHFLRSLSWKSKIDLSLKGLTFVDKIKKIMCKEYKSKNIMHKFIILSIFWTILLHCGGPVLQVTNDACLCFF